MKPLTFAGILLIAFVVSAEAQTRLNFPKVLSQAELPTTGFAFVNSSVSPISATFTLYGANGSLAGRSLITVPAKGQRAVLASDVFPTPGSTGWVQISSPNDRLQGFELIGNFATQEDGAGPAIEATVSAAIYFSSDDLLHVANPNSQAATAQVTLKNAAGETLGTRTVQLAAMQSTSVRIGDISDKATTGLVSITANNAVSASVTTKLKGGEDIGVTNAVPTASAPSTLVFPFAPNGQQGNSTWEAFLGVANVSNNAQTISITFTSDDAPAVTIQRNLPPGASVGDTARNLFGLGNGFSAGWIRVTGTASLVGAAAYQDSSSGSLAIVPSQSSGSSQLIFGHIASLAPWYTGIALLNTSGAAANVEIFAVAGDGALVGSQASFMLAPGARRTALLSEFVPDVLERINDGGFVFVRTTNGVPIVGFELFGHTISPILANVQGFNVETVGGFNPPAPARPAVSRLTLDSVSFTDVSKPKAVFAPRDAISYVASITSPGTAEAQLRLEVKDPRGGVFYTTATRATFAKGSQSYSWDTHIPSNALNGQYLATFTLGVGTDASTLSGIFDVAGGTDTPTAAQDSVYTTTTLDDLQLGFRPGDIVRFHIATANFLSEAVSATVEYQLVGPGSVPVPSGSGSFTYSVQPGVFDRTVDISAPSGLEGIYAFTSKFTSGGTTTKKGTLITVVPPNSNENMQIDTVFVTDSDRIPRAGFLPGSSIDLTVSRLSLFATDVPATLRYTVTGPNSSPVLDRSVDFTMSNGDGLSSIKLDLPTSAARGTYTFQASLAAAGRTSSRSVTFVVDFNLPTLPVTLSAAPAFITDINGIARTAFSWGETLLPHLRMYSTSPTPLVGAVHNLVGGAGFGYFFDATANVTFNPGMTHTYFGVETGSAGFRVNLQYSSQAVTTTGISVASTTNFSLGPSAAPPIDFTR